MSFGKLLVRQRRFGEAEQLYQDGCRMTENVNPHIWQVGPVADIGAQWRAITLGSGMLCVRDQPYVREAGLGLSPAPKAQL